MKTFLGRFFGDDVDDAACSACAIEGGRLRHHFDALDLVGVHT